MRARLAVLSAIPELWDAKVRHWMDLAAPYSANVDPADIYQLFQALVGTWTRWDDELLLRIHAWQEKMLREAKLHSSWEAPDEAYEGRYQALAEALLAAETGKSFRADFQRFIDALAPAATANSLAQTLLHYMVPGVPDLYQGCELMDYSMVDPDNRRPVDYDLRRAMPTTDDPGAVKFALIRDLLALRKDHPRLFVQGNYVPIAVTGARAAHVVAFTRT